MEPPKKDWGGGGGGGYSGTTDERLGGGGGFTVEPLMKDGVGRGQLQWNPTPPMKDWGGSVTEEPLMKDWGGGGGCYSGTPDERLGGRGLLHWYS